MLPPLHWVRPHNELGLRPAYWRLKKSGRSILDHGYLDPPLNWIQGVLGTRDYWVLCIAAYNLLRGACEVQLHRDSGKPEHEPAQKSPHGLPGENGLNAKNLADHFPELQWPTADGLAAGTESFKPAINLKVAPTDGSGIGWHLWCQKWHESARVHSPSFLDSICDPYLLIQSSYQWMCGVLNNGKQDTDEFTAALTAFGLGALGAFPRVECDLCFRLAISQRLRCRHHSVSPLVLDDGDSTNIQNSAEARRACKLLKWPRDRPNFRLPGWPGNEEEVICGLLWQINGDSLHEETKSLTSILTQCPSVLLLMPTNILECDANQILWHLRSLLDNDEWNIKAWAGKLFVADEWLVALKAVAPGHRPKMTVKRAERLRQAKAMLEQGMKKSEIAVALGVSRSNLTNIYLAGETELP